MKAIRSTIGVCIAQVFWIALVALGLALMTMPPVVVADVAASESCCTQDDCHTEPSADTDSVPYANDCCPGNCSHCFLPCCGSPVVVIKAPAMDTSAFVVTRTVVPCVAAFDSGYRLKIYHPPGC